MTALAHPAAVKLRSLRARRALATKVLNQLKAIEPDPKCELYFETEFQLLVSVVLSAQTTDKMVNQCMEPLYREGFTPETVLAWGAEGLLQRIRSIGLAPTKSKNVFKLSAILLETFHGSVPQTRQELESLPGVGKKTASVILGELFSEPTIAVDTHVFRVTRRLGLHDEPSPEKTEKVLLEVVNPKFLPKAHHWFILLGRYTCKAQKPACETCALNRICPSVN